MPIEIDFLPIATAGGANVDSQVDFVGSGYQLNGFQAGLAQSKQLNKAWRQSSMISAALANFISNALGINVLDDGNLSALITNLTNAILATGPRIASINLTPVIANAATAGLQNLMSYVIPADSMNQLAKTIRITTAGKFIIGSGATFPETVNLLGPQGSLTFVINSLPPTLGWICESIITCSATGVAGQLNTSTVFTIDDVSNIVISANLGSFGGLSVDLTGAVTLQFQTSFSNADVRNECAQEQMIVEALN